MDIHSVRQQLRMKSIYDIPLRVTYYARVSSESDEQLNSLGNQISYYEDFIRKNAAWTFVPGYIDEGLSGISTKRRENFNRMVDDAEVGKFDLVITKEISRFARNTLDSIQYTRQLLNAGVGVFFQNDNINTFDEDSELRLSIMSSIAQDELRKLSSRVKFGHQQAIKQNVVLGNSRIFGYIKKDGRLVIDEDQAVMVRQLFELYATDEYSMKQLETLFWEKGYRNHNGKRIAHSTMSGMISNPKYKGYYVGNKVKVVDMFTKKQKFLPPEEWVMFKDETGEIVPAIVSEELWEQANAVLRRRSEDVKNRQGVCNHANLLTGKLFCTHCGTPYYRRDSVDRQGNKNSKWVCSGKINNGKDSCDSIPIYEKELIPLLNESEKYRSRNNMLANSCQLSLRHVNNIRLLANIDEEVRELNHENNRFLLSDTNALLQNLVKDGDSSFVFEKIGTTIRNVMIDEFQDTSRMQWDNFRLLLLEGLSQGADSLIVGDVKQSIYRWRNGDWGILNGLKTNIEAFPVKVKTLTTNRRSAANIIHFNNEVFTAACEVLNNIYKEEQKKECKELKEAYNDVCQETYKDPGKGYVKVEFLSDTEDMTYMENTLYHLGEEVELLVAQGVQLKDIAILVRKNRSIPLIADYFDKNTSYKIVSDEAFRLDASLAVCMIMDGLRYLSQPENRIAKAQLAAAYQNEVLHKGIDLNTLLLNEIDDYLPFDFIKEAEQLRLMPLYELMEKLFNLFQMSCIEQQDAYLCAFFDAVTEYLQSNSSELSAFITYWEEKLGSKTIPSGEVEGIRILSIHKSKGLEYHTVLLPFCDWKMENETYNHLVWCAPRQAPFSDLDIVPINYSTAMQQSIYREEFLNERLQLWVDNLNLLYVAFTRAKKNLIIYGKAEQKGTVSELLGSALSDMTGKSYATGEEIYELGTLYLSSHEEEKQVSGNKLLTVARRLPIHLETLETNIEFKQSNRSAEFIRGEEETEDKYIRQGQLLHNLFSVIRTTDDVPPAIERLRFEGIIESAQQEEQIRKLTEWALRHPLVKEWYSGRWELYNECAIIYREKGVLQTRRPDRVMMKDGEVIVVDFKFGKKRKAYNKQVKEYMDLLSDMGYEHIRGYLWYVFNNELEEIE